MSDPLKGKREQIRAGELDHLNWPDDGNGCPVQVGEVFALRNCHIEITSVKRVQKGKGESSEWVWLAFFDTYHTERPYLLSSRGYTTSPHQALKAQDDRHRFASQDVAGQPPEPEAIPPHEIAALPSTVAAKARFAALKQQEDQQRRMRQLSDKMRALQKRAEIHGADLTAEIDEVERLLLDVERRLPAAA